MAIDPKGVNIGGFGYRTKEDISASTLTTDINDSGKVLNFTATCVVTLHAVAAGQFMTFRVGAAGITLTLSPNASDGIKGLDLAGTDDLDVVLASQPVGSFVSVQGGDANAWIVTAASGTLT
jgi:hypothetical protein